MDLLSATAVTSLPVRDVSKASDWYRDRFGAEPAQMNEGGALFRCGGGTMFFLYPSQFAGTNEATALMLQVDDLDQSIAELRSKGVAFEAYDFGDIKTVDGIMTNPDGSRSAWFKDLDGNIIGIGSGFDL